MRTVHLENVFTFHRFAKPVLPRDKLRIARACRAKNKAAAMAAEGYGWEDIVIRTRIPRDTARSIVGLKR